MNIEPISVILFLWDLMFFFVKMIFILFALVFVTSPAFTAVVKDNDFSCGVLEFQCQDGACVSGDRICDGQRDCADGSDENLCFNANDLFDKPVINRKKRQAKCRKHQWQCRDGSCISFDGKCDGVVDCADRSDESHAVCRSTRCQSNWFRCTYGACVDGTAPCNGVQECADNSDELLPQCRTESDDIKGQFKCQDGSFISTGDKCDGVAHCPDGSDETVRACASVRCPSYLFQCAYGACVDQGSDCNGKQECADGSDEDDVLCNRIGTGSKPTSTTPKPNQGGLCVLPQYPEHGSYVVNGAPNARPGQTFENAYLNVSCQNGYGVKGSANPYCFGGFWPDQMPTCVRLCRLSLNNPSVEYRCQIPNSQGGFRNCQSIEPSGTIVEPRCRQPNYYSPTSLPTMRCIDGDWDYSANCLPECGRVTPEGEQLVIGGLSAKHGELPWHVGIYKKDRRPYMQICGGSLVSSTLVISAAHCFWDDIQRKLPASLFAVAAGKIYRPWDEPHDADAQKSDVSNIIIPERFLGAETNYQEDIALVFVSQPFQYKTFIRPVCLNFDVIFDRQQLSNGNYGKVAGWGLTSINGNASQVLKVVELPYVDVVQCLEKAPPGYREHITSDKICAGYENGTALCKGDSGGGLAFPSSELGIQRYYLRGIVSTAPRNFDLCNAKAITSFTQITKHDAFIRQYYSPY